jgi:hypothetical protein
MTVNLKMGFSTGRAPTIGRTPSLSTRASSAAASSTDTELSTTTMAFTRVNSERECALAAAR